MKKILISVSLLLIGCSGETSIDIPEEIASLKNLAVFPANTEPAGEIELIKKTVFRDSEGVLLIDQLTVHAPPVHIGCG